MSDLWAGLSDPVEWLRGLALLLFAYLAPRLWRYSKRKTLESRNSFLEKLELRDQVAESTFDGLNDSEKVLVVQSIQVRLLVLVTNAILNTVAFNATMLILIVREGQPFLLFFFGLLFAGWALDDMMRIYRLQRRTFRLVRPSIDAFFK